MKNTIECEDIVAGSKKIIQGRKGKNAYEQKERKETKQELKEEREKTKIR